MGRSGIGADGDHHDVVVVGSGFGGSVAALRLAEKGYGVVVVEAGRRFADDEFAETSWDVRRFLWAPRLGWLGIQRIHRLDDVIVLAGAGVGGGSLVYANTLYRPLGDAFFRDPQWAAVTDWRAELERFYDLAERMLGVTVNPTVTPADEVVRAVAEDLGVAESFRPTPVGVFFGRDGRLEPGRRVPDPYFGGAGPARTGCLECGACMTGCRHGAKNTLVKNYLHLAESAGVEIRDRTTVTSLRPRPGGGYLVETRPTTGWRRSRTVISADQVVVAAGTWGTQQLLHRMKADGTLPGLSDRLGVRTRTNSEALCGAVAPRRRDLDFSTGVAITSSIHLDDETHLEPVRYGRGSNLMGLLSTVMVDGGGSVPRWLRWLGQVVRHPGRLASLYLGLGRWSERALIALVMQTRDNSVTVTGRRGRRRLFGHRRFRLRSGPGHGEPNPTWIPAANDAMRRAAKRMGGFPASSLGEVVDVPMTAHFLGGCTIGVSATTGVVDAYHRAFGHEGLHVVDGSTISANVGVNPSLTITAQAERAMAMWPNRGDPDPRPRLGAGYRPVAPVAPRHPAVPAHAPAALGFLDPGHGTPGDSVP